MNRPSISRTVLLEILLADEPWSPAMFMPWSQEGDPVIWQHVRGEIAEVQANRLLDPAWSGCLLDRSTVREKMVEVGMPLGVFQIPGIPMRVTMSLATSIADLQLVLSPIDLRETSIGRWERLRAILMASQTFQLEPARFLREFPGAQEYLLRLSSSSVEFRNHQTERIDAKHPDIVGSRIQALRSVLREEAAKQFGRRDARVDIQVSFPMGDDYWAMRAMWLQAVEVQIDCIWPGQGLGSTRNLQDDA